MEKLPISIGILSWHSGQVLVDTLTTYHNNGLFDMVNDVTILFQEVTTQDIQIATHFGLNFIGLQKNIGIGMGILKLAQNAETDNFLILEHDWNLIEDKETTYNRLKDGLDFLSKDFKCVRYRHRKHPGAPLFSYNMYNGKELEYVDAYYKMKYPHLLDTIHWIENPEERFPEFIQKEGDYYIASSRYGNWTNNPCLFNTKFYIECVTPFINNGHITSEGEVAIWWANQNFKVAHGEGLFMHNDWQKYGR
jgi:hypothetical protein